MTSPKLFLTSMSGPGNVDNMTEMIEPLLPYLDGVIWVLHDCPADDPGARYLESIKGEGKVIHRFWPTGRHNHSMNDTLYTGLIQEDDYVIYTDALERPAVPFVSRIKGDIGALMIDADVEVLFYYGKAYLMRYRETMEYRGSPHWRLDGWNGRGIEWSKIEPDEKQVRLNVRPQKRTDPLGWVLHYGRYWLYPAGCNHALLGLDVIGDPQVLFPPREARRLEFRRDMRRRGFPLTMEGLKAMLTGPLDETLKTHLRAEKTLSDLYHYWQGNGHLLKDTHKPSDALPIP